jgi:hypothetical protein
MEKLRTLVMRIIIRIKNLWKRLFEYLKDKEIFTLKGT